MNAITYTHEISERGNGLPNVGDEVILHDDSGWHQLRRIESMSSILTGNAMRGEGNRVLVALAPADRDYDDLTEQEQDEAYESLHHAALIEDETED